MLIFADLLPRHIVRSAFLFAYVVVFRNLDIFMTNVDRELSVTVSFYRIIKNIRHSSPDFS